MKEFAIVKSLGFDGFLVLLVFADELLGVLLFHLLHSFGVPTILGLESLGMFLIHRFPGLMVMPRTPIRSGEVSDESAEEGGTVDASLLPPG